MLMEANHTPTLMEKLHNNLEKARDEMDNARAARSQGEISWDDFAACVEKERNAEEELTELKVLYAE